MNKIAVVILNYNGRDLLRQFLPGVIRHSQLASIVVADNCSTDSSASVIKEEFPDVLLINIPENRGYCGGYNYALKKIDAEYFVLLNSDVEVTENWLTPMLTLMEHDASIGAVQPKVLSWHDKNNFEYAGAAGGWIDTLGYPFCRGRIFDTVETDTGQYNNDVPIFWATGACLAIRSGAFHGMGGFDEDFFAHMEEIDLCWKLHRSGIKVYCAGESSVYHIGGGTLSKLNPTKTYLNFRNGLTLIFKNMMVHELMWKLPLRMTLDWAALFSFLLKGSFQNAFAVLRAHVHFIAAIPTSIRKRKKYQGLCFTGVKPREIYKGSILVDYFLKKKKKFSEILL